MKFTTGTGPTDPGTSYDTSPLPVGQTIREIAAGLGIPLPCLHTGRWQCCDDIAPCPCKCPDCLVPADPDLYARTAPAWTCVKGDGPHYLNTDGGCYWCGKTSQQIHAQDTARQGELRRDTYPSHRRRT